MVNGAKIDTMGVKPTRTQPWPSPNTTLPGQDDLQPKPERGAVVVMEDQTWDAPTQMKKSTLQKRCATRRRRPASRITS
jgi:hypothetical protein